jgi:triosephosphate isomerase
MRNIVICGNWKMNKTVAQSVQLAKEVVDSVRDIKKVTIAIAPTFLATASVAQVLKGTNVKLAVQDIHFEDQGAFTGKVSVDMIKELGVEMVILGHSEQRQFFGETDETVNKKVKKVLAAGLTPIICIGETLTEREGGVLETVLKTQISGAYQGIAESDAKKTIIAYEPVWAIGTGVVATDEQAQETQAYVRKVLSDIYGTNLADSVTIQYGGSMKPSNAEGLLNQKDIDGGLIGGAALKATDFLGIIAAGEKIA